MGMGNTNGNTERKETIIAYKLPHNAASVRHAIRAVIATARQATYRAGLDSAR